MAKLLKTPYPMPDYDDYKTGNFDRYIEDSQKALNAIPDERLFYVPQADGHAYYFVKSFKPLTLQHIPYLDAWGLPDAHIRGLRRKDILENIEWHLKMKQLFDEDNNSHRRQEGYCNDCAGSCQYDEQGNYVGSLLETESGSE